MAQVYGVESTGLAVPGCVDPPGGLRLHVSEVHVGYRIGSTTLGAMIPLIFFDVFVAVHEPLFTPGDIRVSLF